MGWLSAKWVELAAIGVIIALITAAYGLQHHQITTLKAAVATEKQGRDQDRAAYASAAASAAADNLIETGRRIAAQSKAANDAQVQSNRADAADRANARAADGLRIAAHTLASGCRAAGADPAASASSPADRLADVLGESVSEYRAVAKAADNAVIRGQQCSASYDALSP